MNKQLGVLAVASLFMAAPAAAQQPSAGNPTTICGSPIPQPAALPPAGSAPVVFLIAPCFEAQGNVNLVDIQTYLYYIRLKASLPSQGVWVPYNEAAEKQILDDFKQLWGTGFLDNLSIQVSDPPGTPGSTLSDYTFENGVTGKLVVYNLEERQRVKNVDYTGSKKLERTKIEEQLKKTNTVIRLDTFIDPSLIRKVESLVRDMMKEKGFQAAEVTHDITAVTGQAKQVNVVFKLSEGPKVKIRNVEFNGNQAFSDRRLRRRMKENRAHWWLSWITGRGTYQETKYEEDAQRVTEFYQDHGYVRAQVGEPTLKELGESEDKKTKWVELQIPVNEGNPYRVTNFQISGNTIVKTDALMPLFKLRNGDRYSRKMVMKGFQKSQEIYGSLGYMEFTGYPDFKYSDEPDPAQPNTPKSLVAVTPTETTLKDPTVDITLRITEGKQYTVNRIIFTGNTTTHDNVIRRELRLYENGVFNTEALKYSIKRLNQLGYFKPLEGPGKDVSIDKTTTADNKVDVKMKLEEQNRNQLTFGAGVSQFEGFFGQLSFQTSNFLGRGESFTVSAQSGSRAQNYSVAFTEPFLFDRNITGGANLFKQDVRYVGQFTQKTTGGVLTFGFPLGNGFTRMFTNYSYERVRVTEISSLYNDPLTLARNPFLRDSLLIGESGERIVSKVTPTLQYNSVDQPIFPTTGRRLVLSSDLAGLGGNTKYLKPTIEAVGFFKENNRMSIGMRTQIEYIRNLSGDRELPIFEKLFLGGEYSIRGFDLRSIGPQDLNTGLVLGGNKSLLFNVEQIITIAGPVRLILFYDAGQVRDTGQSFSLKEDIRQVVPPPLPTLYDPTVFGLLTDGAPQQIIVTGQRSAFKTSTGAEIRFFMPVLNVPFRLIFAYDPQRGGVLNNQLQQQKAFGFRFAVGTTF